MNIDELNQWMATSFRATFREVTHFTALDKVTDNDGRVKVRYAPISDTDLSILRAVYVIVCGASDVVYVGSYTRGLAKRWLYARERYVYHHAADYIADKLESGVRVLLWLVGENDLAASFPAELKPFINVQGVEAALRQKQFSWNKIA